MKGFAADWWWFCKNYGGLPLVVAGIAAASSASAQEERRYDRPESTIYRDAGYRGPAVAIGQAQPDLGLAWPVNSIRIKSGRWELCERAGFRGTCRTYNADTPMLNTMSRGRTVQSIRPLGGGGGGWPGPGPGDGGPSLRGMASQYFTQPSQRGQRVRACASGNASANCASRSADSFCRSLGWNGAAWQTMQTVNREVYLADVLCTRTGY